MKHYCIARSSENWNGFTIVYYEDGDKYNFRDTDYFAWDIPSCQRQVDKLNQAEQSLAQAKETV